MSQEGINLLISIDRSLRSIDAGIQQLLAQRRATAPKPIASDRELDGRYGNPQVKFNPRDWSGPSCKGRRMSECPADFLDVLASTFDWFAEQADQKGELTDKGKKVSEFKRADAARARGWAKRIRDGKHAPAAVGAEPGAGGWSDSADAGKGWSEQPDGWS